MFQPKIHLCNEVLRDLPLAAQARLARDLGYDGLELAPFTLAADPTTLTPAQIGEVRAVCDGEGAPVAGLHWLLNAPVGLSITSADPAIRAATLAAGERLVALCADLGGTYLVHGSPTARRLDPADPAGSRARAADYFAAMADHAAAAGCRYLIEPLSAQVAETFTSLDEAFALVQAIGSPALGTMLDCYAAASDGLDLPALLAEWLPRGALHHIHLNDDNAGAPGQGGLDFTAILDRLARHGYHGALGVEPFDYRPDGPGCARIAQAHLRDCLAQVNRRPRAPAGE